MFDQLLIFSKVIYSSMTVESDRNGRLEGKGQNKAAMLEHKMNSPTQINSAVYYDVTATIIIAASNQTGGKQIYLLGRSSVVILRD